MKQCNQCGAQLAEDARFCGNCGAPAGDNSIEAQTSAQPSPAQEQGAVPPAPESPSYQAQQGVPPSQPSYGDHPAGQGNPYQQPYGESPNQGFYQRPGPYGAPNGGYYGAPQPGRPVTSSTYLVLSILALLFCLPLGIPAIIFATKIDRANQEGRYFDALKAAKTCKVLLIVAGSLLAAFIVFYIIFIAIFAGYASAWYY